MLYGVMLRAEYDNLCLILQELVIIIEMSLNLLLNSHWRH